MGARGQYLSPGDFHKKHWDLGENPRSLAVHSSASIEQLQAVLQNKQRILIAMRKAHCQVEEHLEELSKFKI